MELTKIMVSINRKTESDPKEVSLSFDGVLPEIILSDEATNDLKFFFNTIFDCIIAKQKIIEFELQDSKQDLFQEIAEDIIDQLNSEIKQSEDNFEEFLALMKEEQLRSPE